MNDHVYAFMYGGAFGFALGSAAAAHVANRLFHAWLRELKRRGLL